MIMYEKAAYFSSMFMITEITALTDNLMWYYKMLVLPDQKDDGLRKRQKKSLAFFRAFIFVFMRVWIGPFAIYKASQVNGSFYEMLHGWTKMPLGVSIPGISITLLLCFLNFVWTFVIVNKYWSEGQKQD